MVWLDSDLVRYSSFSRGGGFLVPYVGSVRGLRVGVFPDLDLTMSAYRSVQPSLQAFRAETMVERFTARMHVHPSVCS